MSAYADAIVSFNNEQDSGKEKLTKIREVVKPHIGKNGKLTMRGDKITANFKVPFVAKAKVDSCADKSVAMLVFDNGRLQLIETPYLKALNSDLSAIDFSIDVDLKANHIVYKIVGDESAKCTIKATAVFVDGEAHVNFVKQLAADDSIDIEFRCDTDASVWHQIKPYIEWGEFLTNALKTSSMVAPQMKSEFAVIERDLANAVSLREFLSVYMSVCEKDYILRTPRWATVSQSRDIRFCVVFSQNERRRRHGTCRIQPVPATLAIWDAARRHCSCVIQVGRQVCSSDFVTLDCAENVVLEDSRATEEAALVKPHICQSRSSLAMRFVTPNS